MTPSVLVLLEIPNAQPALVGEIYFTVKGGALVSSMFTYDTAYLSRRDAIAIDPALPLGIGGQPVPGMPGVMQDCSPDKWGRSLITKQRREIARLEGRLLPALTDVDFLVGVGDFSRQGALRFREHAQGPFLSEDDRVPALIELPRLLRAADAVSRDGDPAAIKELLDAGTGSLGGARPKASVRDGEGRLLIAKFPHPNDEWDVMAWEKTALDLAAAAGINVPETRLERIDKPGVLLLDRFDRRLQNRVPYMSAMTLLGARDGDSHDYVDVAEALAPISAAATADLRQLWRRILFSVLINNTDDHLRNHGLLHEQGGWRFSPAFDINPNPDAGTARQTSIGGAVQRDDAIGALADYASLFSLTAASARQVTDDVAGAVAGWRDVAVANGIGASELALFADAFRPLA